MSEKMSTGTGVVLITSIGTFIAAHFLYFTADVQDAIFVILSALWLLKMTDE